MPFALTMLLRMDDSAHCLHGKERAMTESRLQDISRQLTRSQKATGTWLVWVDARRPTLFGSDLMDRVSVMGHHLEWMAMAPANVRPEPAVIRRAVAGLINDLHRIPVERRNPRTQLPLTHAARALVLLSQAAESPLKARSHQSIPPAKGGKATGFVNRH